MNYVQNQLDLFTLRNQAYDGLFKIADKVRKSVITPDTFDKNSENKRLEYNIDESNFAWGRKINIDPNKEIHVGLFGTSHAINTLIICNKFGCRDLGDSVLIQNGKNWLAKQLLDGSYTTQRDRGHQHFIPKSSHLLDSLTIGNSHGYESAIENCINTLLGNFERAPGNWSWLSKEIEPNDEPHPTASALLIRALMYAPSDFRVSHSFEDGIANLLNSLEKEVEAESKNDNQNKIYKNDLGQFCLVLNTIFESNIPSSNTLLKKYENYILNKLSEDEIIYLEANPCFDRSKIIPSTKKSKDFKYTLDRNEIVLKSLAHLNIYNFQENGNLNKRLKNTLKNIQNESFFSRPSECEIYPVLTAASLLQTIIEEIDKHEDYIKIRLEYDKRLLEIDSTIKPFKSKPVKIISISIGVSIIILIIIRIFIPAIFNGVLELFVGLIPIEVFAFYLTPILNKNQGEEKK